MTYDEIVAKVAEDNGLSKSLVNKTYRAYWKVIREYITSLPLKDDMTDDEFNKLKPNINIPSIGKFNVTIERYRTMKKLHNEYLKNKKDASH